MANHYFDTIVTTTGPVVDGATIYVTQDTDNGSVGPFVEIYSDDGVTPIDQVLNPLQTDDKGFFEFWTDETSVTITVEYGGLEFKQVGQVPTLGEGFVGSFKDLVEQVDSVGGLVDQAEAAAELSEENADRAESAATEARNYGGAELRYSYVDAEAETWAPGDFVQITSSDTGTHTPKAGDYNPGGGNTPNAGLFEEDATLGLVRRGDNEGQVAEFWAGEAEASATAIAPLANIFRSATVAGVTDVELTVDEYGCVESNTSSAGVHQAASFSAPLVTGTTVQAATISTNRIAGSISGGEEYAEVTADEYGCVASGIFADGTSSVGGGVSQAALDAVAAIEVADIDRVLARPDGVNRRSTWTYVPVYGESTSVGEQGQPAVSTAQPYSNITFTNGPKSGAGAGVAGTKPLVEDNNGAAGGGGTTQGETPCSGMSNTLVEYVASRYGVSPSSMIVLSSAPGLGGQTVAQLSKGTANYTRFMAHVTAAKALAPGGNVVVPCWHFICGANDAAVPTSYASFLASTLQLAIDVDADIRAITGQSQPVQMLIYQTSGAASVGVIEPIQKAQYDAAEQSSLIELTSPWYDKPYAGDQFHCINTTYLYFGRRMGIHAGRFIFEGTGRPLKCVSAIARGNTVRLRFNEAVVIDTTNLGAATTNGLRIVDTGGTKAISNMVVDRGDILITLGSAVSGAWSARIALDYRGSGLNVGAGTTGHSCNVRASLSHTYYAGGSLQTIYRWAPHQEVTGYTLETTA